jgi:hypothetical protein
VLAAPDSDAVFFVTAVPELEVEVDKTTHRGDPNPSRNPWKALKIVYADQTRTPAV